MKVGILHTAFIGDLSFCGLLIQALFDEHHEIYLFTNNSGKMIYEYDTRIIKIIQLNKGKGLRKIKNFYKNLYIIKPYQLDILFVPHLSINSSLLSLCLNITQKISFTKAPFAKLAYHKQITWDINTHESVRYLTLAKNVCISNDIFNKYLNYGCQIIENNVIPQFFINKHSSAILDEKFFIIALGSVWVTKIYPPHLLAEAVFKILQNNSQLLCLISAGPHDKKEIIKFNHAFKKISEQYHEIFVRLIDTSQSISLKEYTAVAKKALFVIANDSGPLHLAEAVSTPVIGIYGPTFYLSGLGPALKTSKIAYYSIFNNHKLLCQPCSAHGHNVCPQKHHRCMQNLQPNIIVNLAQEIINTVII